MPLMMRLFSSMIVLFLISGCSSSIGPLLGKRNTEIPILAIDENLSKAFPIKKKASYGEVKILAASTLPTAGEDQLIVRSYFNLISFEIPEGINGVVQYTATLRYDPSTQIFYLDQLTPQIVKFKNPSLEEYLSPGARQGITSLIAKTLATIPVYRMKGSGRSVKGIMVKKEHIEVTFN